MIRRVILEQTYPEEEVLSRVAVDHYKGFGFEHLIRMVKGFYEVSIEPTVWRRKNILLITHGCHRMRALYELGLKEYSFDIDLSEPGSLDESVRIFPLPSVPLLEDMEYRQYHLREYGTQVKGFHF